MKKALTPPRARLRPLTGLGTLVPGPRRRVPLALAVLPLFLVPLLLFGSWDYLPWASRDVSGSTLVGERSLACKRLVIAPDVSGSMRESVAAREASLRQLIAWLPANLKDPRDKVAIVEFAHTASVTLAPTDVSRLGSGVTPAPGGAKDGYYTSLEPVLAAIDAFPQTECETALILLSDAQLILSDDGARQVGLPSSSGEGRDLLIAHGIHDLRLLVPDPAMEVPSEWTTAFPMSKPVTFNGLDADESALVIARAIGDLTGQELARK